MLKVPAQSAGPVQPGSPLLELGDPSALEIVTEVLSADAVRITPGAKVTLERWGGAPLNAHVRRVEPSGFTRLSALGVEEQRVPVVVDLDEPREKWATLGDGYRVEARIVIDEKRGVLRVPIGAVFRQADGWGVYALKDGRAQPRPRHARRQERRRRGDRAGPRRARLRRRPPRREGEGGGAPDRPMSGMQSVRAHEEFAPRWRARLSFVRCKACRRVARVVNPPAA